MKKIRPAILIAVLASGCGSTGPQIPSNLASALLQCAAGFVNGLKTSLPPESTQTRSKERG